MEGPSHLRVMPLSLDFRGASRPRQPHVEWVERPLPAIRIDTGAPFSSEAIQNLLRLSSSTAAPASRKELSSSGRRELDCEPLLAADSCSVDESRTTAAAASGHALSHKARSTARTLAMHAAAGAGCIVCLLVVCLFAAFCIAFGMAKGATSSLSGDTFQEKLDTIMAHAVGAARNTELATREAVDMARLAHATADEAQPKLMDALNQSQSMVAVMRDFSLHPTVTLSAG